MQPDVEYGPGIHSCTPQGAAGGPGICQLLTGREHLLHLAGDQPAALCAHMGMPVISCHPQ